MRRTSIGITGLIGCAAIVGLVGCVDHSGGDVEKSVSALWGIGGTGYMYTGGAAGTSSIPDGSGVRGFTDTNGNHITIYRPMNSSTITKRTGTSIPSWANIGGNMPPRSMPWGYRRHDGPATVVYADVNRHVHELGTLDVDFAVCCGINAPLAAVPFSSDPVPDVIGYVRSDNQSAMVYRSQNLHVIEIKSNFSGSPPWLATDLTVASGASVVAVGSPFPYVRWDGSNTIVYVGLDGHIHELSQSGSSGWSDGDLSVLTGSTVLPSSDPWGYRRSDNVNAVVFIGEDGQLHEISLQTIYWARGVLPAVSPNLGRWGRPSGYIRADLVTAVVYMSGQTIHELKLVGGAWVDEVLATPGVIPQGQLFGHRVSPSRSSILFQGIAEGLGSYELSFSVSGQTWLQAL